MIAWMIGADRKTNIFGRLVRHRQKAAVFFWKTVGPARAQRQRRFDEDGASFVDRVRHGGSRSCI